MDTREAIQGVRGWGGITEDKGNKKILIDLDEYKDLLKRAAAEGPVIQIPLTQYVDLIRREMEQEREISRFCEELKNVEQMRDIEGTLKALRKEIQELRGDLSVKQMTERALEGMVRTGVKRNVSDSVTEERR